MAETEGGEQTECREGGGKAARHAGPVGLDWIHGIVVIRVWQNDEVAE
jgi:hypothetical protein